jgi:methionyl-tRNA formyltransferase
VALRVVFLGTPAFAVPTLDQLLSSPHDVVAVVTQPDRPRGRGHRVVPADVKRRAIDAGLPILQPERIRDDEFLARLRGLSPDLGVVAAYGKLLSQAVLDLPRLGMVNVHASLLPRWRGAAPVHRAILAGDAETGVTIMKVVRELDAGPMLARTATGIGGDETSGELEARLAAAGARLLIETLGPLELGHVAPEPQDDTLVTYARRLSRQDSPIDWTHDAPAIHNQVRGLQPWPQASASVAGRRLLVRRSAVEQAPPGAPAPPGAIVTAAGGDLIVATGGGLLRILELQPEGRAPQSARAFLNGHRLATGDRFEAPRGTAS